MAGAKALPLIDEGLDQEDALAVFAAAYSLLHFQDEASTERVLSALPGAEGERLQGLRDAMCYGPLNHNLAQVQSWLLAADSGLAAVAAEVLVFHSALEVGPDQILRFLPDDAPLARERGWRLVGYLGLSVDPKAYGAAMRDEDDAVKRAALQAGAWCREQGVLLMGRKLAEHPAPENLDALELLAILGGQEDLSLVAAIGNTTEVGPDRFRVVGTYGHPQLIELVLAGMADPDPGTAWAAGRAFTKMTGLDIESNTKATLPPAGGGEPDEFEAEFLEEVMLPDPERARHLWQKVKGLHGDAPRICQGYDITRGLGREAFAALDMESRWEACLRAKYYGAWDATPLSLEVYPQRQ